MGDGDDRAHHGLRRACTGWSAGSDPPLLLHGHVHPYGRDRTAIGSSAARSCATSSAATSSSGIGRSEEPPCLVTPASPAPTSRTTSCACGAARSWPSWPTGCAASPTTSTSILPFDEVVAALGYEGERGARAEDDQARRRSSAPSTRRRDFDRRFRPTSARVRERWEQLALAQRQGASMPPIDVYRVGDLYFVQDGHHRVSIALAHGPDDDRRLRHRGAHDAAGQGHPHPAATCCSRATSGCSCARVPLPPPMRAKITVTDPWSYAELGESVEAWGFRYMQHEQRFCDRAEIARRWFTDEYTPVVRMLREADLLGDGTEAEAYLRVAAERYRLILTHEWNDDVIRRLRERRSARAGGGRVVTSSLAGEVGAGARVEDVDGSGVDPERRPSRPP